MLCWKPASLKYQDQYYFYTADVWRVKRVVAVWSDFFHFGIPRSQGKIWEDTDRFPSNWKEQISCSRLFRPAVRADGNKISVPLRHRVESYVVRSNVLTFSLRMVNRKFKNWCYVLTYILRIKLDFFFFNFFCDWSIIFELSLKIYPFIEG